MRPYEEKTCIIPDGQASHEWRYRHWPAQSDTRDTPKGAIVLMRQGHEQADRASQLVEDLNLPDFAVFAWNQPVRVRDVESFHEHLADVYGLDHGQTALIAQGPAALIASAWVLDYAPDLRCLALLAPAFANAALDKRGKRVVENAPNLITPTLVLLSGEGRTARRFFENLGSPDKAGRRRPDDRAEAARACGEFIGARFAKAPAPPSLLEADRHGFSREVQERISRPLAPWSARGLYWAFQRRLLRFGARFSEGLRLGVATGFDSGSSLDYVYRNTPTGTNAFGRFLDQKGYHQAIGWRGIRQRKVHMEELLRQALRLAHDEGLPCSVLDVAAGHGRYVLDALGASAIRPDEVLLRDFSERNVAAGRALIAERGLADSARFERGDAFNTAEVAALRAREGGRWGIGIVSGLFELFPENAPIRAALAGLAGALAPGGLLLVTNQPWHPQQEYIARVLRSHRDGRPWVMRCRSQAEMDQLLAAAGFTPLRRRVDEWGIFSVTLARRQTQD